MHLVLTCQELRYTCVITDCTLFVKAYIEFCYVFDAARLAELIGQLEERERNSEAAVQTMDKELTLKQQAIEMHKHKALESVQSIQEWQLKVNDLENRIANAESALQSKVEECEKENMAVKRWATSHCMWTLYLQHIPASVHTTCAVIRYLAHVANEGIGYTCSNTCSKLRYRVYSNTCSKLGYGIYSNTHSYKIHT